MFSWKLLFHFCIYEFSLLFFSCIPMALVHLYYFWSLSVPGAIENWTISTTAHKRIIYVAQVQNEPNLGVTVHSPQALHPPPTVGLWIMSNVPVMTENKTWPAWALWSFTYFLFFLYFFSQSTWFWQSPPRSIFRIHFRVGPPSEVWLGTSKVLSKEWHRSQGDGTK